MNSSLHTIEFISFCKQFAEKQIIIYGASKFAVTLNELLSSQILAFIDKDISKQNSIYLDKPIFGIEMISKIEYDLILIATVGKEEEIIELLMKNYNINRNKINFFQQIPTHFYLHKYELYKYEYQLIKNILTKLSFSTSQKCIAPGYFLYEYFNCYPLEHVERLLEDFYIKYKDIEYIIIPSDFEIGIFLKQLLNHYYICYSNALYLVYKINHKVKHEINLRIVDNKKAAFITTYNRPEALKKTLLLLKEFDFCDILVVDDNSDKMYDKQYNKIFEEFSNDITIIKNPKNRGLAYSLNVGFSYLLADSSIKWISYFQDDITYIDQNIYEIYSKYENSIINPIITGYYAKEHPIIKTKKDNDLEIYFLLTTPGVHIHMHRKFINNFLPIPTNFLGAPKNKKHSHTDWWMSNWSLNSPLRNGNEILCIPNLVKTDLSKENSTYRNTKEDNAK